jgi:hypothetical protein
MLTFFSVLTGKRKAERYNRMPCRSFTRVFMPKRLCGALKIYHNGYFQLFGIRVLICLYIPAIKKACSLCKSSEK